MMRVRTIAQVMEAGARTSLDRSRVNLDDYQGRLGTARTDGADTERVDELASAVARFERRVAEGEATVQWWTARVRRERVPQ